VASRDTSTWLTAHEIAFESFGVRIGVGADDARVGEGMAELIPPYTRECDANAVEHHFSINGEDGAAFTLRYDVRDGEPAGDLDAASYVASGVDLPMALGLLDTHLHGTIAFRALDRIFVHAGAVAYLGRMIVMPGPALNGKSTLVAALVRAGGTYYSDQFAVLDEQGRVHPYATSNRLPGDPSGGNHGSAQSGLAGEQPVPVGAIVLTSYRPGAEWRPKQLSRGEGVLAVMSHTVPAQDRPEESMHAIRRMLETDPLVIESDRDEADALAPSLLAELEQRFSASA
jgi:hypothetical protein